MTPKDQVESYINELKIKIKIWGVVFLDERGKNAQALLGLNITPAKRIEILNSIKTEDYSDGPINEVMRGILPMWVFGKFVNSSEVYIKTSMGNTNSQAVCISFHIAEHTIDYPYKS